MMMGDVGVLDRAGRRFRRPRWTVRSGRSGVALRGVRYLAVAAVTAVSFGCSSGNDEGGSVAASPDGPPFPDLEFTERVVDVVALDEGFVAFQLDRANDEFLASTLSDGYWSEPERIDVDDDGINIHPWVADDQLNVGVVQCAYDGEECDDDSVSFQLWSRPTDAQEWVPMTPLSLPGNPGVVLVDAHDDGATVAVHDGAGNVELQRLADGEWGPLPASPPGVYDYCATNDGSVVGVGLQQGSVPPRPGSGFFATLEGQEWLTQPFEVGPASTSNRPWLACLEDSALAVGDNLAVVSGSLGPLAVSPPGERPYRIQNVPAGESTSLLRYISAGPTERLQLGRPHDGALAFEDVPYERLGNIAIDGTGAVLTTTDHSGQLRWNVEP